MEASQLLDLAKTYKKVKKLKTLGDVHQWLVAQFEQGQLYYGHGTEDAWDEAVALLAGALGLPPDFAEDLTTRVLTEQEKLVIVNMAIARINERLPLAYITHRAWFAGHEFYVDERVLVPRSPLAELIDHQFSPWVNSDRVGRILDLCTGSGCIAIACAHQFPAAAVDASDISTDALAVAEINVQRHQLAGRVKLHQGDLFAKLPQAANYDIIISNPPYVDHAEMSAMAMEFSHEPRLGLAAGNDGLDIVKRILSTSGHYLANNGILIVEVGASDEALQLAYPNVPFTWLEFEYGGRGVFLLTAEQVRKFFASGGE